MIKIGVIGYGYWGPNLVRNFAETPGADWPRSPISIRRSSRRSRSAYPAVQDHDAISRTCSRTRSIDAIAIATPVSTHFELGMAALKAGKHLWLEKPMTETSLQARKLIDEAEKRKLVLLVDHTFIYTGAVRKMAELIKAGDLGRVYYYDSIRVNLGLFQRDVSVISDLGGARLLDPRLPARRAPDGGVGQRHQPLSRHAGEPGVHHAVLRLGHHRARQRELAGAGQGAPDPASAAARR